MNKKTPITLGVGIILIVIISGFIWLGNKIDKKANTTKNDSSVAIEKNQTNKGSGLETIKKEKTPNSFKYNEETNDYYGGLVVRGYVSLIEKVECEKDCRTVTLVDFNIVESDNDYIYEFINDNEGNSFVGDKRISLGCVDKEKIWRQSGSMNKFKMANYYDSSEISKSILNSNIEKLVNIEIVRYPSGSGRGVSDCFSLFAEISLAK